MIDDTNCTTNYKRYVAHDIRQTVSSMSGNAKQRTLEHIQAELLLGTPVPNPQVLEYVQDLLNDKQPSASIEREVKHATSRQVSNVRRMVDRLGTPQSTIQAMHMRRMDSPKERKQ